jgi:hypothetical protein
MPKKKKDWCYTIVRRPCFALGCSACSVAMLAISELVGYAEM